MNLLSEFLEKYEFESYEDFTQNFKLKIPENFDYARDVVDRYAEAAPEQTAIVWCDDEGGERILSFAEVSSLSKKAASYFVSLGIRAGDRVLTLLRRRWEYWICAVALHRIGAVVVPASVQLTTKDIVYRVNSASATMIIALNDDHVKEQLAPCLRSCPQLSCILLAGGGEIPNGYLDFTDKFIEYPEYNKPSECTNSDEMVIYFTSGTSGYPKMTIHNRLYPLGHIITAKYMQCVSDCGLHLTQADSGWAKFGWGNIYGQWICGSAILAYDPIRFDASRLTAVIRRHRPTSICVPPTIYRFLLKNGLTSEDIASVKWFSTAGEPLSGEVNNQFKEISGQYIHEAFGQSEGTPITCSFEWFEARPSSMGKPSPLYDTAIIDPSGKRLGVGEHGEVVIFTHGKNQVGLLDSYCFDGHRYNPAQDGIYHTGDIAYMDEDGFFWYVGRNDDMIKSSGYRVGPFEIESVLNTHPAVLESAVYGVPDELRGQLVCAAISLREGYTPSEDLTRELKEYVKVNTAPYKYPRVIRYLESLPKTTSGKIIRRGLENIPAIG